jgi:hypothetical protein
MQGSELTREVIGSAIEVHRELGPGKREAAYERALAHETAQPIAAGWLAAWFAHQLQYRQLL